MSRGPRLALILLLVGAIAAVVAAGLTVLTNWFFRGEAGLTSDTVFRSIVIGFVVALMPLGIIWVKMSKDDAR